MAFENAHALVVGVGVYKQSALNALVTSAEAIALSHILKNEKAAGFPANQVKQLTGPEATRQGILKGLEELGAVSVKYRTEMSHHFHRYSPSLFSPCLP